MLNAYLWLQTNGHALVGGLFAFWGVAEVIVRLTPTKKDDGALERAGKVVTQVLNALGLPNRRAVEVEIKTGDKNKAA